MRDPVDQTTSADLRSCENTCVIAKPKKRHWKRRKQRNSKPSETSAPVAKEFVCEDVFLMENRSRQRIDINLLTNSLTARLRQRVPDYNINQTALNRLRRESLKDFVHLDNLNRQYSSALNWESSRLDSESFQLIKRQRQLKRQSLQQQQSQEKMEAQLRQRSSRSSVTSSATLPRLADSRVSIVLPTPSPKPRRDTTLEDYPEFAAVDKEDTSRVKVFKLGGIFQPQNKYSSRHELDIDIVSNSRNQKRLSFENEAAAADGKETPCGSSSGKLRGKKGLRVTWSSQSQYYGNDDASETDSSKSPRADTHSVQSISPTPSTRSTKSDISILKKPTFTRGRSRIATIGLQWKLPPGAKPEKPARQPCLSRNLNPVTSALHKEGQTTNKTRWQTVQKSQSLSTYHMYTAWLEKLEVLKGSGSKTPLVPAIPTQPKMPQGTAQIVK